MAEEKEIFDITIIGGGPVGLFTAFYGGLRQAKVKVIEAMPQLGGQLSALYPEKYVYDIAGFPKIRAQELVDNLTEQAMQFNPTIVLEQSVAKLEKDDDNVFKLTTDKEEHYSKTIIITAGVGAFKPRRLDVEGAEQFEGKNLHYFVNDLNQFAGDRVVLAGGGDSAVDWTLMLEDIAKEITIVHRRDKFRAHEHSVEQLRGSEKINVSTPYMIESLDHDGDKITAVTLKETKGEATHKIDIDTLIVNYGFVSNLGPIKEWGLELKKNAIMVNTSMETNIDGIYACGDIATYEGKAKLIASGFGEAPTAINKAKVYIDPTASATAGHSTSLF
ncbi:ferredoxin--NADP(+) reductase [Salipaludibacillus neizhouensis]|uniref:Ferredoxin--NADP reductase n=1 Tax=Salipaludibacillus neizhouensis TaxID=885475 RepID=A0A3A9KKN7_9BACI|nr:NAD(P)/FAD-dependent oxidoreductase [Salipaludibacillus neizhouensis]RKL65446.1 ferredoxin--NADP(+) reductase [Salipaludibacillus neizhouensis]